MKKIFFILAAILALQVSPCEAQSLKDLWNGMKSDLGIHSKKAKKKNNAKGKDINLAEYLQSLANGSLPVTAVKPLPEAEQGWKLTRSNTVAGFKCDHYEKDGANPVRVFRRDNGDFITFQEDKDGLSREPKGKCLGEYRLTCTDGTVVIGGFDDTFLSIEESLKPEVEQSSHKAVKVIFPNGSAIVLKQELPEDFGDLNIASPVTWNQFKSQSKPFQFDNGLNRDNWGENTFPRLAYLYLPGDSTTRYPLMGTINDMMFVDENRRVDGGRHYFKGFYNFIIGNRVYSWSPNTYKLEMPRAQLIEDYIIPAIETDTIVSIDSREPLSWTYANGGKLTTEDVRSDYKRYNYRRTNVTGKLIRSKFAMTIKDQKHVIINYSDGTVFAGSLGCYNVWGLGLRNDKRGVVEDGCGWLADTFLTPWTGTFEYSDGQLEDIRDGKKVKQENNSKKSGFLIY